MNSRAVGIGSRRVPPLATSARVPHSSPISRIRFLALMAGLNWSMLAPGAVLPPASEWKLPPLDGELAGELNALRLGGAPKLKWTLTLHAEKPRERTIGFALDGQGFRVRGEARLDPLGEGDWRVSEAAIDLGEWFGWLAPQLAPDMSTVVVAGALQFTGQGTWREGALGGKASISLRDGRVDDSKHKVLLEGISVDIDVADLAARRTDPAQVFTWRSGHYDVVPLGVGRIEFMLDGTQLSVNQAAIDIFGGELRVGSLVMSTDKPTFSVDAQMVGVAVDQVLFLLPHVLSEAHGRLDGNVALSRDETGVQIGNGRLTLREGETADLRLAVKPGWLTTSLPPAIVKYFPGFRKMENGEIPIRARQLEITLTPLGDAKGRTAWVHIAGGPSDPELTAPIDTTVNVRGPLETLIELGADLGTDPRLRFRGAK
jgi:hypothetical protein